MSRNPVARNGWKVNRAVVIPNKKEEIRDKILKKEVKDPE